MFSRNSKDHRFWTSSSGSRDRATPSTDIFPIKKELEERGRRRDGQIWDCIQAREHRNTLLLLVTRRDANWTDNNPSSNRPVLGVRSSITGKNTAGSRIPERHLLRRGGNGSSKNVLQGSKAQRHVPQCALLDSTRASLPVKLADSPLNRIKVR